MKCSSELSAVFPSASVPSTLRLYNNKNKQKTNKNKNKLAAVRPRREPQFAKDAYLTLPVMLIFDPGNSSVCLAVIGSMVITHYDHYYAVFINFINNNNKQHIKVPVALARTSDTELKFTTDDRSSLDHT